MPCSGGIDAARVLGQASLSPMLEGEGSSPVRDFGLSPPIICDTDWLAGCLGFSLGYPVCSPSLRYLKNKNYIPNSVIAELELRITW